jgi:hypothetical protein
VSIVDAQVRSSQVCVTVFGTGMTHEAARQRRNKLLKQLSEADHSIWLVHQGEWQEPAPHSFANLELLATATGDDCRPIALVSLDPGPSNIDCPAGLYAAQIDDSIGYQTRILGILDGVVLTERAQELGYIKTEGAAVPNWRMVWRAPFTLKRPRKYSPARPSRGRANRKRGRR